MRESGLKVLRGIHWRRLRRLLTMTSPHLGLIMKFKVLLVCSVKWFSLPALSCLARIVNLPSYCKGVESICKVVITVMICGILS